MSRKFDLPVLTALPAFEAAARRRSFTKASEELNLTQSAVSFQVRKLEASLGVPLFVRNHRDLSLTPAGQAFFKAVETAFFTLEAEKAMIARQKTPARLTVSAPFSLSSKWLIPRLRVLLSDDPGFDLRVDATDRIVDLFSETVELAIRYCVEPPKGLSSVLLFNDLIIPVCSPRVFRAMGGAGEPGKLVQNTLLHDEMWDFTWRDWLESAGLDEEISARGHHFSHTGGAIDAAIADQGVALGRLPLVIDDLAAGRLVRPLDVSVPSKYAYYVVWPETEPENTPVRTVIDWLLSEARATARALP